MFDPFLPKKYFIVKGVGLSERSTLNAFDKALMNAGIAEYNLVPVSSIIPSEAVMLDNPIKFKPGTIVFTIMARIDGVGETLLSAGVGVAKVVRSDGFRYGFVVESYGNCNEDELKSEIMYKLEGMAEVRNVKIEEVKVETVHLKVPKGYYGSAIAAVIFSPPSY